MTDTIEIPEELAHFQLPSAVEARLQELLDRQDAGEELMRAEREEAEGLVALADFLTLLELRAKRNISAA
jgi:hypothetical protein